MPKLPWDAEPIAVAGGREGQDGNGSGKSGIGWRRRLLGNGTK